MDDRANLQEIANLEEILVAHQKTLKELELKVARYAPSAIPVHDKTDLDDQREKVNKLKAELQKAKLAAKEAEEAIQAEESRPSRMRSRPLPDRYYIQRKEAKKLLDRFDRAIAQPDEQNPLLFNIFGIGGVGKTTLLGRLQKAHVGKVDFLEVCFAKTAHVETPLKLMRHLHAQAIALGGNKVEDSFAQKEKQFEEALYQLTCYSLDGEKNDREDENKIRNWFETTIWLSPINLTATPRKPKSFEFGESGFSIGEDMESVQEWIQQRVRNHPTTKDNGELQALMLQPVPKLTQAFAESLIQIIDWRKRSLVLVLDTYEKVQPYLNQWLWQYLVEDTPLASSRVRLMVVGRRSLQVDEGWRKFNQDRKLLHEVSLHKFSKEETKEYLEKIGIKKGSEIAKIYKITQGLPYYLDWIRKQHEEGEELDFSKGNQAIADLLLQGTNSQQRKILQVVACCRWFDLSMIQYLLNNESLSLKYDTDEIESIFKWLTRSDFVEFRKGFYRLDDVARDVFRQSYFQDNRNQFWKTNALLAGYFKKQAEYLYDSQNLLPDPYEDEEWRELISESLYYGLFGKRKEGLLQYIEQIFIANYWQKTDIFIAPFTFINAEINEENKYFLPRLTGNFLKDISIIFKFGWHFLSQLSKSYKFKLEDENIFSEEEIFQSLQFLLGYVGDLENGLGKCLGLMYKSLRSYRSKEKIDLIWQAESQINYFLAQCRPKLTFALFSSLGLLLITVEKYRDSLNFYNKALEFGNNSVTFLGKGIALNSLERYEEALESYQKAIEIDPKSANTWAYRGNIFRNMKQYEKSLVACDRAYEIEPKNSGVLNTKALTLSLLKDFEKAVKAINEAINLDPQEVLYKANRGIILARAGRYDEALVECEQAIKQNPKHESVYYAKACYHSLQGEIEPAINNLKKAIDIKPRFTRSEARHNPDFDGIRDDERFQALIYPKSTNNITS
ncbi:MULTISPECIES: tetratricopeptide repeat protein [Spirulina sp. CCY15215]|uniref:tetratricopeptide repeat protein n=1 Tax=Spirulina sp. CCY15215 TaxID=2767591 RepID=UPI0019506BA2|nr:tetratricopeptide repeat protein [Spirulina major]